MSVEDLVKRLGRVVGFAKAVLPAVDDEAEAALDRLMGERRAVEDRRSLVSTTTQDVRVNVYRVVHARESSGLSVGQVRRHFGVDAAQVERTGRGTPAEVETLRDLYLARPGWLEQEGPIADPRSPWGVLDMIDPG